MVITPAPTDIQADSTQGDLMSVGANIALLSTVVFLSIAFLVVTAVTVFKRGEI